MALHACALFFWFVRAQTDRETIRSITDWLLLASVHQEPEPSQVTAAGSCTHVTRPGTTPRGTPNGERGSDKEGRSVAAAAIDSANCRRVISILICSSRHRILHPWRATRIDHVSDVTVLENRFPTLASSSQSNVDHCSGPSF